MPISFDSTGFVPQDQNNWRNPVTGDGIGLLYFTLVPDLPAGLDDLPKLRHDLAVLHGEDGCLIEAHVVQLGGVPALLRILKMPLPNRPAGQLFVCSFTVPRATASAVLQLVAPEGPMSGMREAALAPEVGFDRWVQPHPYAPQLQGRLPFHAGDDPRFDSRFPDHPLTRVRQWAHHVVRTARIDPQFAALPPFQPAAARPPARLVTALPGIPVGNFIALQIGERTTFWRMTDPDLAAKLGCGVLGRSQLAENRSRDMVLIDVETGQAMIPDRTGPTVLQPVSLEEADAAISEEECRQAFQWVGRMIGEAEQRGEYLSLEPIENQGEQGDRFVLLAVQPHEGERVVVAQFSPPPAADGPLEGSESRSAPATPESIEGIGMLAGIATNEWKTHLLRLAITFKQPAPQQDLPPEVAAIFNATLVNGLCGVPVGDYIALQIGERTTYWKMLGNDLRNRLGRGNLGRSPLSEGRFREIVVIDEQSGHGMLMDRFMTDGKSLGISTQLQPVSREEAYAAATPEALKEAYQRVGRLIEAADGRREYLTLEPIVNQGERVAPYAMMAMQYHEGEDIVLVSCDPVPSENTPFKGSRGINAPVKPETIKGIGELAMHAMLEWGPHPLDMAITFNRYPNSVEAHGTPESVTDEVRAMFAGPLTAAVPGVPIGGYVALQHGEQRTYWRLPSDDLKDRLGFGRMARTHHPGHRYREVVLIDQHSGEALIPDRYGEDNSTRGSKTALVRVTPEEAMAAATPEACREAFERLGRLVYFAAKRGEYVLVELLEHELRQEPQVLLDVQGFDDDQVAVASASPAPSTNTTFNGLPTLEGPASGGNIVGLGPLALEAINDWGVHPLHVVPTFHRPTR